MHCISKKRRVLAYMIGAAVSFGWTATATAQSMVVRSTGPSASKFPVGTTIKDKERIALLKGDRIVLLNMGTTRTLTGPGTYKSLDRVQVSQNMQSTVTRMIDKNSVAKRSRGGFTRGISLIDGISASTRAPNLWLIDYRQSGKFCVADAKKLLFWRPDMSNDALLTIETEIGEKLTTQSLAFTTGANYRRWPSDRIPLAYDVDYRLSGSELSKPVTIRLTPMNSNTAETAKDTAQALLTQGCMVQFNRLINTMTEAETNL